jgi:hypothetical protein
VALDVAEVRRLALALPEVEEYEHGDRAAFRIRRAGFATMLDADGVNLMPGEDGIRAAVAGWPDACEELHVAGRLAAVRVSSPRLPEDVFAPLLEEAWGRRAPTRLFRLR